ncbi:hypothetical protein SAMN02799630_04662 [Paenibacillus sp. UNCCL117]|uniref:restriction endonuclease n=1 Tax=unclassified Paenibacillus TaxID=185978 RepID=UPI000888ACE0|nr:MULTISPECIES: restriction endonuclease [unclassified Paenibacillus]SDE07028.1 hypothetical protein SAMN04488602_11833 [Paenibacillus sp. cl123]SFW59251.1 hypothetical protein SAMN02799630_04662 [Paenibacillus sp. UNCCL117]
MVFVEYCILNHTMGLLLMFVKTTNFQLEEEISLISKPVALNVEGYPYSRLEDRPFEILNYLLHKLEIEKNAEFRREYAVATLMQGVGERGIDVLLQNSSGECNGAIQCKRYANKIDRPSVAKEIIKFGLHILLSNVKIISDLTQFTYFFSVSNDFSGPALELITDVKNKLRHDPDLDSWIASVIESYTAFNSLKADEVKDALLAILEKLKYKKINSVDLDLLVHRHQTDVVPLFFEVKIVYITDVPDMALDELLGVIYSEIENINDVRCSKIKDIIMRQVEDVLAMIGDIGEEEFKKILCAIKLPFKFIRKFENPRKFKFADNLDFIKHLVVNMSLISLIIPDIKLNSAVGQAINLPNGKIISYIHSSDNREYNSVVLQLLKHFNKENTNLTSIETVIVDNVAAANCLLGQGSAQVNFDYIIPEISNVDIETPQGKEEFSNLREKFNFIYHCAHAFNYNTLESEDQLIQSLKLILCR